MTTGRSVALARRRAHSLSQYLAALAISLEYIQKAASLIISELDSEPETEEVGQTLHSDQGQTAQAMHA